MSLKKLLLKTSITRKIYLYYNLYIRNKAHKKRNSYSQWGEDQIIKDFFKDKKKVFYILENSKIMELMTNKIKKHFCI